MFKFLILVLFSASLHAEITIVMKGSWVTECISGFISFHNRYDKALQSAINQSTNCNVIPPLRFEVRNTDPVEPDKKDIILTWNKPELREDESKIISIDRFNIYQTSNDGSTDLLEADPSSTSYKILDVQAGDYSFQISTVEDGQEGAKSAPIHVGI